jgi:hypothetical protein
MNPTTVSDLDARTVAAAWFDALTSGRIEAALGLMADEVEFVNYVPLPGYNDDMPWIGTYRGREAVRESFGVFVGVCEVLQEELVGLAVDGTQAMGVIHERSRVRSTGLEFEIEFIQRLTIEDGRITQWKSYTDPSPIIRAIRETGTAP